MQVYTYKGVNLYLPVSVEESLGWAWASVLDWTLGNSIKTKKDRKKSLISLSLSFLSFKLSTYLII